MQPARLGGADAHLHREVGPDVARGARRGQLAQSRPEGLPGNGPLADLHRHRPVVDEYPMRPVGHPPAPPGGRTAQRRGEPGYDPAKGLCRPDRDGPDGTLTGHRVVRVLGPVRPAGEGQSVGEHLQLGPVVGIEEPVGDELVERVHLLAGVQDVIGDDRHVDLRDHPQRAEAGSHGIEVGAGDPPHLAGAVHQPYARDQRGQ